MGSHSRRSAGAWIGGISLVLAALAYAPSFAAFHPAFILTLLALPGSVIAGSLGAVRLAALTLFIIAANSIGLLFITGRLDLGVRPELAIAALGAVAILFAAALLAQHLRARRNDER